MVGILQTNTVAHNGFGNLFYSLVLRNNLLAQNIRHCQQTHRFLLRHSLNRNTRHRCYHLSNIGLCHFTAHFLRVVLPAFLNLLQLMFQRFLLIAVTGSKLKVLLLHSRLLLFDGSSQLYFFFLYLR